MWRRGITDLGRGFLDLVYPNACLICDAAADRPPFRHGLCIACHTAVTADPLLACPRCAATVGPHTDVEAGCANCRGRSLGFTRAVRLGVYDGRLRDAALRIKHAPGEPLAEMLGRVLADSRADALKGLNVSAVVPVPLHWRRRWARGYDQAAAVAREVAGALGVPFRPGWVRRVRYAVQQFQPSAAARRENVRGAFRLARGASAAGRSVLVVDDVMTTGSTAGEVARVLRAGGAAEVAVAVLGKA